MTNLNAWQHDRAQRIWDICDEEWPKWNSNRRLHNYADCSGFVTSVATRLSIPIKSGQANEIFDYLYKGNGKKDGWSINGQGSDAALVTGLAATEGQFCVGVWRNNTGENGHIAILAQYMGTALRAWPDTEQKIVAYWGQKGGIGQTFTVSVDPSSGKPAYGGRLSVSFRSTKHPFILYASYANWE